MKDPLQLEKTAEREWLFVAIAQNVSEHFSGKISINKVAANWKSHCKSEPFEVSGLRFVDDEARKFVASWSKKKPEIADLKDDSEFEQDIRIYVARQIWNQKLINNFFVDSDVGPIVFSYKLMGSIRKSLHESCNRAVKVHGVIDAAAVIEALEQKIGELWNETSQRFEKLLRGIVNEQKFLEDGKDGSTDAV